MTPRNHGHSAWAYLSTFGGGLLARDSLHIDVEVCPQASAFLSSQGPTRVFHNRDGGTCAAAATNVRVGDDALLVSIPEPLTLFADARFEQANTYALAPSANLIASDILTAGRVNRDERWAFSLFDNRLRIDVGARTALDERVVLDAALARSLGTWSQRLGRFDALGSLFIGGPRVDTFGDALRHRVASQPLRPRAPLIVSASPVSCGVMFRYASHSVEQLVQRLHADLEFLPRLLGDNPLVRRP